MPLVTIRAGPSTHHYNYMHMQSCITMPEEIRQKFASHDLPNERANLLTTRPINRDY